MNIQKVFDAVKEDPDQHTLITAVIEIEDQGYTVLIAKKYHGSEDLLRADEENELQHLPMMNGVFIEITKDHVSQSFRIHFLDNDQICFSNADEKSVFIDNNRIVEFYRNSQNN
jgi:hypothetical protein